MLLRSLSVALLITVPRVLGDSSVSPNPLVLSVDGQANIFGAGHSVAPAPYGGGGGALPPVIKLPAASDLVIRFGPVAGTVCCFAPTICNSDPDGVPQGAFGRTDITSFGGISGIVHDSSTMFLVGVFLDDDLPTDPAPPRLEYGAGELDDNFIEWSPLLRQTFFIGDGLARDMQQVIRVPIGATRLYLGFADSKEFGEPSSPPGFYGDNGGSIQVTVAISSDSPVPTRQTTMGKMKDRYR